MADETITEVCLENEIEYRPRSPVSLDRGNLGVGIVNRNDDLQVVKCDKEECCEGLYHCPFCSTKVYKPAHATKTINHIYLSHFPHAVYYIDLVIVKCFQGCRKTGHYHCPICPKQIVKRTNFKEHLINHIKAQKKNTNAVQVPNSKKPPKVCFSAFEDIELCSQRCKDALGKHYHCPVCKLQTFIDLSSLVTHVWKCKTGSNLTKKDKQQETVNTSQLAHPKSATNIQYHKSIVRSLNDLQYRRCMETSCCSNKYHCPLCTDDKFKPNYHKHLVAHLNIHWKNRIEIDGYFSLVCYSDCVPRKGAKTPVHFHCPFCGQTRRHKLSMGVHVEVCKQRGQANHQPVEPCEAEDTAEIDNNIEESFASKDVEECTTDNVSDFNSVDTKVFKTMFGVIPANIQKLLGSNDDNVKEYLTDICQSYSTNLHWFTYEEERYATIEGSFKSLIDTEKHIQQKLQSKGTRQTVDNSKKQTVDNTFINNISTMMLNNQSKSNTQPILDNHHPHRSSDIDQSPDQTTVYTDDESQSLLKPKSGRRYKSSRLQAKHNTQRQSDQYEKQHLTPDKSITNDEQTQFSISSPNDQEEPFSKTCATMTDIEYESDENSLEEHPQTVCSITNDVTMFIPQITIKSSQVVKRSAENPHQCPKCKHQGTDFTNLLNHLTRNHKQKQISFCEMCEQMFSGTSQLKKHLTNVHGPKPQTEEHQCMHCKKAYKTARLLAWHLSYTHKVSKLNLSCKKCTYKAKTILELRKHKASHRGHKQCEMCGRKFKFYCHLKSHIESVHVKSSYYTCEYCSKVFYHERYLKQHLKRHTGVKTHVCHICNAAFYQSNTLQSHLETHNEPKDRKYRFVCSFCGSKYNNKTNFEEHLNKHTGNKPHKCQICPKTFGFRSMLRQHVKFSHSNDKPYKCEICDKAFKVKARLTQHMTTHTGVSKHTCSHCQKPFTCGTSLKKHIPKCKWLNLQRSIKQEESVTSNLQYMEMNGTESQMIIVETGQHEVDTVYLNDVKIESIETQEITEVHEVLQPAEELFVCSECDLAFNSLEYAQNHIATAHSQ